MSGPADDGGEVEARVRAALARTGLPYEWMEIDPAYADTAEFCERYGVPLDRSVNTIVVASKKEPKQYAACGVLATTRLDVNHAVRRLMGVSRLSFADAEETRAVTGMMIGGVTLLALPETLPIYVDARAEIPDWIILGGGSRGAKIKIAPEIFRRLPNATLVPDLAKGP